MPSESELNAYYEHALETMAKVTHAATRDGSVPAIAREAVKDVRNTLNEFFFGKGERGGEPGTPYNPLFHDIIEARRSHEAAFSQPSPERLATPGEIAGEVEPHRGGVHGPQQGQGTVQGDIYGYEQGRGQPAPAPGGVHGPEQGVHGPEKGFYGRDNAGPGPLPTPGEIADDRGQDGPLGRGVEVAQVSPSPQPEPGGWAEKIRGERTGDQGGNDQGSLERGRVLPDEQMERDKGRGR
jgi:hypothetical protein